MREQGEHQLGGPSWWTVGWLTLIFTVVTNIATAALSYGRLDSNLSSTTSRNEELKAEISRLSATLEDWRKAYERQSYELRLEREQLAKLQNDRCNPIAGQVDNLRDSIERSGIYGYSADDIARFQELFSQLNQTLQACYNAKL